MRLTLSATSFLVFAAFVVTAATISTTLPSVSRAQTEEDGSRTARMNKQMEMQTTFAHISGMKTVVNHLANLSLACETSSDCAAIPMGQRACGGPTSFVVTSKANPSFTALVESIQLVTKAEDEANKKFDLMSICSVELPPAVNCAKADGETQSVCTNARSQ